MPEIGRRREGSVAPPAAPSAWSIEPHMPALARYLRWYITFRVVIVSSVLLLYTLLEFYASPEGGVAGGGLGAVLRSYLIYYVVAPTYGATLLYIALLKLLPRHL